jgi:hypothetical protein
MTAQTNMPQPWPAGNDANRFAQGPVSAGAGTATEYPRLVNAQNPKDYIMKNEVHSASDDRTANNAVRHTYRVLSDAEKQQMIELKDIGAALIAKCNEFGKSRELSLAVTNAEQAVMWAVKHVTA